MAGGKLCARPPDIYAGEQEQPDHVNKVPVPRGELEAEVLFWSEMAEIGADQADDQECRADDHVRAVKSRRHEEGRAIDIAAEIEAGMAVLVGLDAREGDAERDGEDQPPLESLAIVLQERVVRPGHRGARS